MIDFITFDCYGTLIDWENGIAQAFARERPDLDRATVLAAYARTEADVERERYRPYRDVLTESSARVGQELGVIFGDRSFLVRSLPSWEAFADTNAALERLRAAGCRLGILSNVDRDLLAETRQHFTVPFDLIITAEDVGAYKPAEAHFLAARDAIGNARWLHAAQSNFHDIVPANALGIETAWINRHGQPALPGGIPTHEFRDLEGLAEWVERPR